MSTVLTASFGFTIDAKVVTTNSDSSWTDNPKTGTTLLPAWTLALTDGTTANKAQKSYHKNITIVAAATLTLDMNAIVSEAFGTLDFTSVAIMIVRLRSPAASKKLVMGNAAATQWVPWLSSGTVAVATVCEDIHDLCVKSWPVDKQAVAGGGALLKFTASGADCNFDLILLGH